MVEFFITLLSKTLQENGLTDTNLDLTDPALNASVKEQRHRGFGRCYTIHLAENHRERGLYYFKIWL